MSRICLYYIPELEQDRWVPGDRYWRPLVRRVVRGVPRPSGVDKVFINLCLGLDKLGVEYKVNLPYRQLRKGDRVGVLGRGKNCLRGYNQDIPIVAGIGLMTHPSEWPDLFKQYPVVKYLQHSNWASEVYKPYFGNRCAVWPVGIDTEFWQPIVTDKSTDFLIYDKVRWNYAQRTKDLIDPIRQLLVSKGLSFEELRYGSYEPNEYKQALSRCHAMIFLCEHESQGIAYLECLSSNIPILAWDVEECLDPKRFEWQMPKIQATSVPFWDVRCGLKFETIDEFKLQLNTFLCKLREHRFSPRDYVLENLTLEKCAQHYLDILDQSQFETS